MGTDWVGLDSVSKCLFVCLFDILVYSINSILYQRGIYPSDSFNREQKYGITLLVTTNKELQDYLSRIMNQIKGNLTD